MKNCHLLLRSKQVRLQELYLQTWGKLCSASVCNIFFECKPHKDCRDACKSPPTHSCDNFTLAEPPKHCLSSCITPAATTVPLTTENANLSKRLIFFEVYNIQPNRLWVNYTAVSSSGQWTTSRLVIDHAANTEYIIQI